LYAQQCAFRIKDANLAGAKARAAFRVVDGLLLPSAAHVRAFRQYVPVFGVSVDKLVALSNDPMQVQVSHTQTHDLGRNLYARLEQLAQRLQPTPVHAACVNEAQSLPNGDTVPDSGAENGVNPGEEAAKKAQVNRPQD